MSELPISVSVAQAVGIFGTIYSTGASAGISGFLIPVLRQSPTPLLLSQWRQMYRRGAVTAPPLAIITTIAYAYTSYQLRSSSAWKPWAVAAALSISIVPFTFAVVFPTNKVLECWEDRAGEGVDRKDVDAKITEWTFRHTLRSSLSLAAGLVGLASVVLG